MVMVVLGEGSRPQAAGRVVAGGGGGGWLVKRAGVFFLVDYKL